jgi:alpha-L-rhamnosidase
MYGKVSAAWTLSGNTFTYKITVPANTTATVILPGIAAADAVLAGGKPLKETPSIGNVTTKGKDLQLVAGSGTYEFSYRQ